MDPNKSADLATQGLVGKAVGGSMCRFATVLVEELKSAIREHSRVGALAENWETAMVVAAKRGVAENERHVVALGALLNMLADLAGQITFNQGRLVEEQGVKLLGKAEALQELANEQQPEASEA